MNILDDNGDRKVFEFSSTTKELTERCMPTIDSHEPRNLIHIINKDSIIYEGNKAFIMTDSDCSYTDILPLNDCRYIGQIEQFISHSEGEGLGITLRRIIGYTKDFDPTHITSLDDIFENEVEDQAILYPNPANSKVFIEEGYTIERAVDLYGNHVECRMISDRGIDISSWSSGTYFIYYKADQSSYYQIAKLIKQ